MIARDYLENGATCENPFLLHATLSGWAEQIKSIINFSIKALVLLTESQEIMEFS